MHDDADLLAQARRVEVTVRLSGVSWDNICPYCGHRGLHHDSAGPLDTPSAMIHITYCPACGSQPLPDEDLDSATDLEKYTGWSRPEYV